jgi:Ca2+-binding EF-hand superfamily protein
MSLAEGPINFDASMRATAPREMKYDTDPQVPVTIHGEGNFDFGPRLAGFTYRQPNADPAETFRLKKEMATTLKLSDSTVKAPEKEKVQTLAALSQRDVDKKFEERPKKQKGHKKAPKWNPRHWYEAPHYEQVAALQKENGETWNSRESHQVQGDIKAHDRMMRTVRCPEDAGTPRSQQRVEAPHPTEHDKEEYYPGRSLIDRENNEPGNDFQVRPVNLPDFHNPPAEDADPTVRMRRIREVIKQRYAGRPGLLGVFRTCSMRKPGYVFPRDLQQVLDSMGVKAGEHECDLLVKAVDKDGKGAITFEEFADLVYGPRVNVGGKLHEAQDRHVHHITKTLVDNLIANGQVLGRAFGEMDPERQYLVSKLQFASAVTSACNHISAQAIDFLWASQFPGHEPKDTEQHQVDWRKFMSDLAYFHQDNRMPTPCCVQGRKRQYDFLQRTAALTGGYLGECDLNRPDQNPDDEVRIVADKLVFKPGNLPHRPRQAALLTENYVEELRGKAQRVEKALPKRIPPARLRELLKDRQMVHQDELIDLICQELEDPDAQPPLPAQNTLYGNAPFPARRANAAWPEGGAEVLTLGPEELGAALEAEGGKKTAAAAASENRGRPPPSERSVAAYLKMVRADIEAFVATQKTNRDDEVDTACFMENVYRPADEWKAIDRVNDGFNRHLRGHRPPRERPPHGEEARYDNYWQARYLMEAMGEAFASLESSSGGKLKPARMFKRFDIDGDGYISLSDLRTACEKYNIPHNSADLHAVLSELDKDDNGCVNVSEFSKNYIVHQGNILDDMEKTVKSVYHEGGVEHSGPAQDALEARDRSLAAGRAASAPPPSAGEVAGSRSSSRCSSRQAAGVVRIPGSALPPRPQSHQEGMALTGKARISDVMRGRFSEWKPQKAELYTSQPKARYGLTMFPDTRHTTEPSVPLSSHFMSASDRFRTTNDVHSIMAAPDRHRPQVEDDMKKHARAEFRVERTRQRQKDIAARCWAANEANATFDEMKLARKAMNAMNYERKTHMAC